MLFYIYDVFDGLWFDFPTPFKKGDILCEYVDGEETFGFCRGPFVMKGITPEGVRKSTREHGDTNDMNAWGYFQDPDGTIYYEVMFNYMNLEFYRGDLKGVRRILTAFGNYLKGKIDEALLCRAYHYNMCEDNAKQNIPRGFTEEGMRLAGIDI